MPDELAAAILLGAFVGLRIAEAAGLRPEDIDILRGVVLPAVQWPAEPLLKTEGSGRPIPIAQDVAMALFAACAAGDGTSIIRDEYGRRAAPWTIRRAFRVARLKVPGLPPEFCYQDLRHYYASLLIAARLDVKVVQARMRHASATTTLNVYGHLWPDSDDPSRAAVAAVFAARDETSGGVSAD